MKPSSAKAKGRKFQQHVRDRIVHYFPNLTIGDHKHGGDVSSTSMGAGGEDIRLSPAARNCIPISAECKNLAKSAIYGPYEQAAANAGDFEPVVFIRANNKKIALAVIDMETLLQLYNEKHDAEQKEKHWSQEAEV